MSTPTVPRSASTMPGTPTPTPVTVTPRARACSQTRSSSSPMVSSAVPGPRAWVGAWWCSSTRPSAATRPAATVVPPTSTPITTSDTPSPPWGEGRGEGPWRLPAGVQVPEVNEPDALPLDEGARLGIGEAGQLRVPLASVAAVGEIVVEVPGVGHELGHAARQPAQVREHALRRPVGVRARLAHEVIRRLERELPRRRPHLRVLGPHRHLDGPREIQHQVQDRLLPADMVMGVEVRGEPAHDLPELVDLHPELDARLVRSRALGGLPGIPGELPFRVQERAHPLRGRPRRAPPGGSFHPPPPPP